MRDTLYNAPADGVMCEVNAFSDLGPDYVAGLIGPRVFIHQKQAVFGLTFHLLCHVTSDFSHCNRNGFGLAERCSRLMVFFQFFEQNLPVSALHPERPMEVKHCLSALRSNIFLGI
jgi:hypothetical protein